MINDSGNRTKFESGAVRDIQEGKGRCDLLPLDIIDLWCDDGLKCTLYYVGEYLKHKGSKDSFLFALDHFAAEHQAKRIASGEDDKMITLDQYKWNLVLEVAKHFEEGAKKYGDRNWEKGIPCTRYIDSAVRHYCKWRAGWTDEPHDRAFIWNILCCEWTRQRYGWNLERLDKSDFSEKPYKVSGRFVNIAKMNPADLRGLAHTVLGMKAPLLDIDWPCDEDKSESEEGVKIGEQFSKGIQDGIKQASSLYGEEAAKKVHWGCSQLTQTETTSKEGIYDGLHLSDDAEFTMTVEGDFSKLFEMLGIEESDKKDQEIMDTSDIKEVLENVKKSLNCRKERRENFRKCLDTSCYACEYNAEPFSDIDALQTFIDYVEKSLKVAERRNPYVKDTDEGWHFYDKDGRLIGYIFKFKEPEEGRKRQLSNMIRKVWHEATSNPYTIKRIVEEWGYVCGKDFSICIAPDIAVKEYNLRNRKYNKED